MRRLRAWAGILLGAGAWTAARGQAVVGLPDPAETPGTRPYEMVWAGRREPAPPTVRFDDLRGWTLAVRGGAQAELHATRAQNVWDRPVARLRYRGEGRAASNPSIALVPPAPIPLPAEADTVEMWVCGNRWDWENPPDTPPVRIALHLRDSAGAAHVLQVDVVRWKEWWLLHRRLPAALKHPAVLERIEVAGGWQPDWREIFLDSARFFRDLPNPLLRFAARPRRNLTLFPGQSPGANTGPGRLPFPTREETILPAQLGGPYRNSLRRDSDGFVFEYRGRDARIEYRFEPGKGLSGLTARVDGAQAGRLMDGGSVRLEGDGGPMRLVGARLDGRVLKASYAGGTELWIGISQKSLILDVINRTGRAVEVAFGQVTGLREARALYVPPITYGSTNPSILVCRVGSRPVFASVWPDWYRSNGSELYGAEHATGTAARINGGIRYHPKTDGARNPLYERVFVTVSPRFEEVLPVIPNPVGLHAAQAGDRLWQESWGPDDYARQMRRSRMLRAYGIEDLIQCNHEITWRDGGESFTLRTRAAPGKGGDEALRRYVAHQRSLGWLSGLYTNYTDFAPVNSHWNPDWVQREPSGEWRPAWPRCWALKPLAAVEADARLAPVIKRKFGPNSAYTDVHTAVSPWQYTDYDARVPGAGTFAQTFYAYGELLRNDSRVYGGPIFSEGGYQWLYAGLADGNYGHTYNGRSLAAEPLLPVFDLREVHTRECDIGVSWTSFFCDAIPNWRSPENLDRAIDRFLLHTLAYGHIGWLVEEDHGIARTCRSYYMLQQVQSRYALRPPSRIAYWNGERLVSVSQAVAEDLPRTRRQLYVAYAGGLELWLNDHPSEEWLVHPGGRRIVLPPAGWAAWQPPGQGGGLLSWSARSGAGRQDYLRSSAYVYLDGRGRWLGTPEAGFAGSLAVRPAGPNRLQVLRIAGDGPFLVRRPFGVRGAVMGIAAFDVEGGLLARPVHRDGGRETWVEPVAGAVRYEIQFSGRPDWSVSPARAESAPGSWVPLHVRGGRVDGWDGEDTRLRNGQLWIPEEAPVGSWVHARARAGRRVRDVAVRVCAPVEWSPAVVQIDSAAFLRLDLRWRVQGLEPRDVVLTARASGGWTPQPGENRFRAGSPSQIGLAPYSTAPPGAEGRLELRLEGLPGAPAAAFRLRRVSENALWADLARVPLAWGIARRGQAETGEAAGTGAACRREESMSVGGTVRPGLFMHPPYVGGTGSVWADLGPVEVPQAPCRFQAHVGLKDGGDPSDGVLFRVEVVDPAGRLHPIGEILGVQGEWRVLQADLSRWRGQRVGIRLVSDCGPNDNSTADWACWGEPALQLSEPRIITSITPE